MRRLLHIILTPLRWARHPVISLRQLSNIITKNLLPLIFLGMWVLIMLFINFNTKVGQNAKEAKDTTRSIQDIVTKQDETLQAIKNLATDNKLTSKQLGDTIICMLQVPISQRTTEVREKCRKTSENSLPPSSLEPITSQNSTTQNTNTTTSNNNQQQNNTQSGDGGSAPTFVDRQINRLEGIGRKLGGLLGL